MAETYQSSPADGAGTKEKAQEAAGQAKDKASEAAGQAKNRLAAEVDTRSTQAGEQLRTTADDVPAVHPEDDVNAVAAEIGALVESSLRAVWSGEYAKRLEHVPLCR